MDRNGFYNWLISSRHLQENTANSRLSNCMRVCKYEGDLDLHYSRDRCRNLLNRLAYSAYDYEKHIPPRHRVPINGNIYTGTATLRAAVQLYINYRNEMNYYYNRDVIQNQVFPNRMNANLWNIHRGGTIRNRDYAEKIANLLSKHTDIFTEEDIKNLTDLDYCRQEFNCHFPVLVEIPAGISNYETITHVWGHRRFYDNITVNRQGHSYLITNDWYHNNDRANRKLFSKWIVNKLGL